MTLLPRITISPIASPSAGTSRMSESTTRTSGAWTYPTPWRDLSSARRGGASPSHSSFHSQIVCGPYVSVSPYTCVTTAPSASIRSIEAGLAGAPAMIARTARGNR